MRHTTATFCRFLGEMAVTQLRAFTYCACIFSTPSRTSSKISWAVIIVVFCCFRSIIVPWMGGGGSFFIGSTNILLEGLPTRAYIVFGFLWLWCSPLLFSCPAVILDGRFWVFTVQQLFLRIFTGVLARKAWPELCGNYGLNFVGAWLHRQSSWQWRTVLRN